MNIIVFGATGLAGLGIVRECTGAGFGVTAFTRGNGRSFQESGVRVVQGSIQDPAALAAALDGQQVIICALGGRDYSKPDYVISGWLERVIPMAIERNISRYLMVSGAGLLQADETTLVKDLPTYPPIFANVNADHLKALGLLRGSHLDWTMVCCPRIVEGASDGRYVLARDYVPQGGLSEISAGNIGRFMAEEAREDLYLKARVGIAARA